MFQIIEDAPLGAFVSKINIRMIRRHCSFMEDSLSIIWWVTVRSR
jgi:hypothetical protein